jgi:two-component system, OmpR family, response regulator ChvI
MNICAKINSMASQNGMAIGSDLYHCYCTSRKGSSSSLVGDSDDDIDGYNFKRIGEYSIAGSKIPYAVYSVLVSKNRLNSIIITPINKSLKSHSDHEYEHQQLQQKNAYNILLVDDEPDTLITYKTFVLDIGGYNVDAFTDSQNALHHFAQLNPSYYDLIVMDIRMPGLNGLQLYYRIKAMNPDI